MKPVYPIYPKVQTVTIANGATTSAEIDLEDQVIVGLYTPSTFDGTTITLTTAPTAGGTHYPVAASNAASTAYTITTTASTYTPVKCDEVTLGLRYIKIVCGTSQSTSATDLLLVTRPRT